MRSHLFGRRKSTTKVPTTRERYARYGPVWHALWARLFAHQGRECKLGLEPQQRRSDKCSACTVNTDLEIDRSVAQLISDRTIACPAQCPYIAFSQALIGALVVGPGAEETAKQSDRVRITELSTALKHIDRALRTLARDRDGIIELAETNEEELFDCLANVVAAEGVLTEAMKFLKENFKRNYGSDFDPKISEPSKRGRPSALDVQGIVRSCVGAWEDLTRSRPGKNNLKFHDLLRAATATVLGPLDPEPDWEWAIRAAKEHIERRRGKLASKS